MTVHGALKKNDFFARSVCSEVEACAGRSEYVRQGQSVVRVCAARLERVQRGPAYLSRGRSVCSEIRACAARLERAQRGWAKFKFIKVPCTPAIGTIPY